MVKHRDIAPEDVWKMFYDDKYDGNEYNNCEKCKISSKQKKIYVFKGKFYDLNSGSINIETDEIEVLHSSCFFTNCSRYSNGGAVHFNCISSIVQHRFCTTNSYVTGGSGFHSYTNCINNDLEHKNHITESCIAHCNRQDKYYSITIICGNCGIFSSNISRNCAYSAPVFSIENAKGKSNITFSTFEGNSASSSLCLVFRMSSQGFYEVYKCNIVNNSQESSNWGIIHTLAEVTFKNCTILGPYGKGMPFSYEPSDRYKFYIINCNVDSLERYNDGQTFYTSVIVKANETNLLPHLSTYLCDAIIKLDDLIFAKKHETTLSYNDSSFLLFSILPDMLMIPFYI